MMRIEDRILELERGLKEEIDATLQKEECERPCYNFIPLLRLSNLSYEPQAHTYAPFVGLINEEDKKIIDEAKQNWAGNNHWLYEARPDFEEYLEQDYLSERFFYKLLDGINPCIDPSNPYRTGFVTILDGSLIVPNYKEIPQLINRLNDEQENRKKAILLNKRLKSIITL